MKLKKILFIIMATVAALIPVGSFAVMENLTEEEAGSYYTEWMLIGLVCFLAIAGCLYAYWRHINKPQKLSRSGGKQKHSSLQKIQESKELKNGVLLIIGAGLLIRLLIAIFDLGYGNDVALFEYWGSTAADDLFNTYNVLGENIDYPPGYVYILFCCGIINKIFGGAGTAYDVIIRLPAILSDCGIAFFIYLFTKDSYPKKWVYFFVAFWMFNPLSFLDSALWGQVDSVLTLALVSGLYLTMKGKHLPAAAVFGGAIMLKPQALIVLPVFFFALVKNKKISTLIYSVLIGIGTAIVVAMPFALSVDMTKEYMIENVTPIMEWGIPTPFAWILSLFMGTAGHYNYASVNALNLFFGMGANWTIDSEPFMGLTYFIWGMIFIVIAALLTWFIYIKSRKSESLPFVAASVILMLVANFGPRMHERYFYPAVVFLLIAAILRNNRTLMLLSVLSSTWGFFTVLEILVDLNLGQPYMWPGCGDLPPTAIQQILAFGNVAISVAVTVFAIKDSFGKIEGTKYDKKIWGR